MCAEEGHPASRCNSYCEFAFTEGVATTTCSPSGTMHGAPTSVEQMRPKLLTPDPQQACPPVNSSPPSLPLQPTPASDKQLRSVSGEEITTFRRIAGGSTVIAARAAALQDTADDSPNNLDSTDRHPPAHDPQLVGQQTSLFRIPRTPAVHTPAYSRIRTLVGDVRSKTSVFCPGQPN